MKNILSIMFLFALLASSCSEDELAKNQTVNSLKFTASFEENESRTYVEEGNLLRWTSGDQISLFVASTLNQQYQFEGKTGANSGYFNKANNSFGTGNDLNRHYAVYPYASDIEITENGVITATLPSKQNYAKNSFGLGANTMVAITKDTEDTYLKFKNLGGYLKLQLYGNDVTIKSITLTGNNNEKLAGKATITSVYGQDLIINMDDNASNSITLDCGEGVEIGSTFETATAFWIVIPPTTFENGFMVMITDVNDNEVVRSTINEISIERNVIKPMEAFEVKVETIPNNQIWYTSSNGIIVTPNSTTGFGANIVSNVYENGKGIITFDDDVTSIEEHAFRYCDLTSITIPESVINIGDGAFYYCKLTYIKIPDRVTSIGMFAFSGCSLTSIVIPKSVNYIGGSTPFSDCNLLSSITVEQGNPTYDSRENCNAIIETASNTLISGCKGTIIPNSVTNIGVNAFRSITSLQNIIIPNSVSFIDQLAFCECSSLESITIPKDVLFIGHNAFTSCSGLKNIIVENGNSVYDSRENCNAIIETESNILIQGCENTIIPNTVTKIEDSAFGGCSSLASITIPESVTSIGYSAFWNCSSLTSIVIANGLTDIGEFAFHNCSSLLNITIPESVTNIGNGAFWGCTSLSRFNIEATVPPTIGPDTFVDCNSEFYVPTESIETYKAADYWKDLNLLTE